MSIQRNNNGEANEQKTLNILAVSDIVEPQLYNSDIRKWMPAVDLLISCGDLPPDYLDFLASMLNVPLAHVLGNHCFLPHNPITGSCSPGHRYLGAFDLNERTADFEGLLLAGIEGSPLYNGAPHQYTDLQISLHLLKLVPGLLRNKMSTGRYLDVLVTHAPPRGIHDGTDIAHIGFASLLSFIERYKPMLMLHGHTHRYDPMLPTRTKYGPTEIINAYGHVLLELTRDGAGWKLAVARDNKR